MEHLKILNNERCERHRELKNQTRKECKFNPGELVKTSPIQGKQRKTGKISIETKGTIFSIRKSGRRLILDTENSRITRNQRAKGK
jgi:hypothetical protein